MRKTLRLLLTLALFVCNIALHADGDEFFPAQVTIGTESNIDNTPFVGQYCYSWNETIYPGSEIGGECTINAISYHSVVENTPYPLVLEKLDIYMAVTEKSAFVSAIDWVPTSSLVKVYSGNNITIGDTPWEKITLDVPFYFNGKGNLAVVVAKKTLGYSYNSKLKWYYSNDELTSTLFYANDANENIVDVPPTTSNSGTRMTYRANIMLDVVYGEVSSPIVISPNPIDLGMRPAGAWMRPVEVVMSTDSLSASILEIESSSKYFVVSNVETPVSVTTENPLTVKIKNAESNVVGEMNGQLTVTTNYGENVVDLKAVTYSPASADVWEKAVEVTEYPYYNTPNFDKLYNNYYLPGNVQDGPDAVYKLTVEEPTTLAIGVNGENAKIALYESNFKGKGGPDVDNYYGAEIDPDQPIEPDFPEVEMPEVQGNSFSFDFNDGKMDGWRTIDADGDHFNWNVITSGAGTDVKCLASYSYDASSSSSLKPDNYVVTVGSYSIDANSTLEFDIKATEDYFINETYAVVVSLDGVNFQNVSKETFYDANWNHKTVSLSAYAGKDVVIGFRHFETGTKSFAIFVDNVTLTPGRGDRYAKSEKYTVPAGTYYLAVSATERFSVNINAMTENGFNPVTEVVAQEIDDNKVSMIWSYDFIANGIVLGNKELASKNRADEKKTVLGYNIYRRNTLNDAEPELIAEGLTDTTYTDVTWNTMTMGLYQWGVSVIYDAGNGAEFETPAAYSNILGKDMFTPFSVAVTTENGLSPAGTKVSFYNVYEPSYKYEAVLDETGVYNWEAFRRGTYRYSMSLENYKPGPSNQLVEIWDNETLEYTFEEKFVLGELFVSSTAWAMWTDKADSYQVKLDGELVAEVTTPYYQFDVEKLVKGREYTTTVIGSKELEYKWTYVSCEGLVQASDFEAEANGKEVSVYWTLPVKGFSASEFKFDFEDETLNGWVTIDGDGDGYTWANSTQYSQTECGFESFYSAMSHSCMQVTPLTPDNYLSTAKRYLITENSRLNYVVSAENKMYSEEHYGIAISTKSYYNKNDFTTIWEETLPKNDESITFHGTWYERSVDLSAYAGQEVYIAFRHFNCTDQFWINIDNVELTTVETRRKDGEWVDYFDVNAGNSTYDALGLQGGSTFYWGVMYPAKDLQQFAGKSLTKVSIYDIIAHEGRFLVYVGGDKSPGNLIHAQDYKTTGSKTFVEYELTTPVDITGDQNVWVVFNNYTSQYAASYTIGYTDPNGRWFSTNGINWTDIVSTGYNLTWLIRSFVEEVPIPNSTDLDVIGAMLYRDGELLTEQPIAEDKFVETLSEYGEYEYSLRVVYGGEEEDTYYAMSCPQTINFVHDLKCKAPKNLYAASAIEDGKIGTRLEWPYTLHGSDWLYYDNGIVYTGLGLAGVPIYWAVMFPAEELEFYNGTLVTKVALFDYESHDGNIMIYYGGETAPDLMIHSQPYVCTGKREFVEFELTAPIPVDASMNLWVVINANNGNYPAPICKDTGNKNGRWMSTDGVNWADIGAVPDLAGTFMVRAYVTSDMRGDISLGGERNANRDSKFSHYNVYRGTSMNNLEVVAQPTVGYYFDEVSKGSYYYQVTATYVDGDVECESEPANSYLIPEDNYVKVEVTAVKENALDDVMVYPNPTNGNLNIAAEGLKRITLINALGQVMYDSNANSDKVTVNMSSFDAGVYMLRIATENGMTTERVSVIK